MDPGGAGCGSSRVRGWGADPAGRGRSKGGGFGVLKVCRGTFTISGEAEGLGLCRGRGLWV